MAKVFKFELGFKAKDSITGFEGVIGGRTEYLTGCVHYGIMPQKLKPDGGTCDWEWFDESRVILVSETKVNLNENPEQPSGPMPSAPQN